MAPRSKEMSDCRADEFEEQVLSDLVRSIESHSGSLEEVLNPGLNVKVDLLPNYVKDLYKWKNGLSLARNALKRWTTLLAPISSAGGRGWNSRGRQAVA